MGTLARNEITKLDNKVKIRIAFSNSDHRPPIPLRPLGDIQEEILSFLIYGFKVRKQIKS